MFPDETVTIDWIPTELRQAQYYVWYRQFSGDTPNHSRPPKTVKVHKSNNFTIGNLTSNAQYLICVQMAGQPCHEFISFSHCADVTTLGSSKSNSAIGEKTNFKIQLSAFREYLDKIGSSIVLIFIGFCTGLLFGLCGCVTMLFKKRSLPSKNKYKKHKITESHPQGTIAFLQQNSTQPRSEIASISANNRDSDGDIMFPDIYTGSVRTKRY